MRILAATIIIAVILASSAFCQVDTLMLVEINSIEVAGEITHLYTESIRDDTQEIFICTQDHIYVFNSQTNELIWSRGELYSPQDLMLIDVNNDGFKDLAFRDSLSIYIYDVINLDHIWMSPILNSTLTYLCYTIGDRNYDGLLDVVTIKRELYGESFMQYTAWLNFFDSPDFVPNDSMSFLIYSYTYYEMDWTHYRYDIPHKVLILPLNDEFDPEIGVFVFIEIKGGSYGPSAYLNYSRGRTLIVDPINIDHDSVDTGRYFDHMIALENDLLYLYVISQDSTDNYHDNNQSYYHSRNAYFTIYSANEMLNQVCFMGFESDTPYCDRFLFHVIGNISNENDGLELCTHFSPHRLILYRLPELAYLWQHEDIELSRNTRIFNSTSLFSEPQLISRNHRLLVSGNSGNISATYGPIWLSSLFVSDLDSDGNDEIFSIRGNTLHIYHLDYYVDVDQPETLPHHTFIQPNYPNPFNSSTAIEYGLKQDEHVTLEIYDLLGRKVETLVDAYQPAGMHRAIWNANYISTGIYFYKINAGDFSKTKKMLLLK